MSDYYLGVDAEVGIPFFSNDVSIDKPFYVDGEDAFADVLGYIDIQQSQRRMNELKAVTVGVAQALLKGGYEALGGAIKTAKAKSLPGDGTRDKVQGKLNWHRDNLAKFTDRTAPYTSADDLKKWVMQAFIEANAVAEGALYLDQAWSTMWSEISTELAKLPQKVREAAASAVQNITGLPVWGWALVGVGGLVLIGGVLYAVINSRAGAAVAGHAARRYLP